MADSLDNLIALVPAPPGAAIYRRDHKKGSAERIGLHDARPLFEEGDVLVAHGSFVAGRLGLRAAPMLFDVLELYAFMRPGRPFVPSALGLARALGLEVPHTPEQAAASLFAIAEALIGEFAGWPQDARQAQAPLIGTLERAGWRWAPLLKPHSGAVPHGSPIAGLEAWRGLAVWEDAAQPGKPGSQAVEPGEARARLAQLVDELRPEQAAYADAATYAFGPREMAGAPRVALLEAGTGTGKTLGYLAPASLWAEKNGPGLWISTYTRNLQRQIVQEIAHLWPDPVERAEKAVVRKGRENYLCLLNFEEAAKRTALAPGQRSVALALIARWIGAGTDGDLSGAGFPAFLAAFMPLSAVTDRRGECIYAACPHYRICFIEHAVRRATHAAIVVANHALVIAQASQDAGARDWIGEDETTDAPDEKRLRYVFDEGHHLFDAADSGFSARLSGREMAELRRWIRGPEARARSRMRGLEDRLKDLIADHEAAQGALEDAVMAASVLAGEGWQQRIGNGPRGPGEVFLSAAYAHVRARSDDGGGFYSLEAEALPMGEDMMQAVTGLARGLRRLADPLTRLAKHLRQAMNDKTATLEPYTKARLDAAARGLDRRARGILPAWISMLETLENGELPEEFVDWLEIAREDGRDADVGLARHWVDPTVPLSAQVLEPAHGALITSATLRDVGGAATDDENGHWASAEVRTGAGHLPQPARRASFGSPFRYDEQARIFVVKDVPRRDPDAMAAAYRELFLAAGGGALGLFTAVRTLRDSAARIAAPLADAGLTLYAQHVDRLDTGALVDLFRAEENACLLGTDALRDGVDVPGRSLRLVVFDKVPWPKPTILHKARRARFGKGYDDLITRFRLKQAFGRLIRGRADRGCFVILEGATPSRLLTAFPEGAPVKRCGLAEAIGDIRAFVGPAPQIEP
ncbi:MAG: ATP-dependent DNA helicase [Alphaproteobacteria bacterium]|nr:ATP-dependent DNA helicase [Alphaproteobacteria bacterium]